MTDTEAKRLAERIIVLCEDADDIVSPEYLVARAYLALLERAESATGLTAAEAAHVQAMKYEIADDGDETNPPADNIERDDANELLAIIDRLSTSPTPGGWRDGYDAAMRGTNERVGCYEREFYPLSNFSAFNLHWKDMTFDTSEAAYHYEKFPSTGHYDERWKARGAIRRARSAHDAFKIAETYKPFRRSDWDESKLGIMRDILRAKAQQHEYVRRKLMETGSREIVEDSWRDNYWGLGQNGDGQNWLGKLWMEVRAELQAAPPPAQAVAEGGDV